VDIRDKTTSLLIETGKRYHAEQVFTALREEVLCRLDAFAEDGFQPILASWKERDFLFGKQMQCVSAEGKIITGMSLGPDAAGQLHVKTPDGRVHTVLSGDIRLAQTKQSR
jgi:biotin-(acetyl-CoA carboxylase) ligase